jgi:hypothetical protein
VADFDIEAETETELDIETENPYTIWNGISNGCYARGFDLNLPYFYENCISLLSDLRL